MNEEKEIKKICANCANYKESCCTKFCYDLPDTRENSTHSTVGEAHRIIFPVKRKEFCKYFSESDSSYVIVTLENYNPLFPLKNKQILEEVKRSICISEMKK